ncbi:MAG: glycosyltransferase family 4 protein [Acetobacteraceae bacterium]|nr:glycosyltransferase family 4 protein [Acetobacteraceae bacterium]
MKVLFLLHAHPDLQAGGTEIFARDLFRTLRARGVDGMLLAGTGAHQRPPSPGTPFQTVGSAADEFLAWSGGFDPFFLSQIDLHGLSHPLADLLCEQQPDIVHFHHVVTLGVELIGLVRRCLPRARIVMTLHDYYPICANDGQMVTTTGMLCSGASPDACHRCFPDRSLTDFKLRELHVRRALEQVDHFVSPSRFLRDRYVAWGIAPELIDVVPNGFVPVHPTPARPARRRDRFAFFGHINRFKGATVALEASSSLSARGFAHRLALFGGTDHQTEALLSRFSNACENAPDARYRGRYNRAEIPRLIADADWVIFPSEWWENAPLVINEAFQHWRPVICSNIGGAAEIVADGVNGLHFSVSDPRDLAQVMQRAVEEDGLWQKLVDGIVPPVGIDDSVTRHLDLYAKLLTAQRELA